MSATSNLITLAVVIGGGALALTIFKSKLAGGAGRDEAKSKAKALLTANEMDLLSRLEAAVPELRIFPQVAMGALMEPAVPRSDGKAYFRLRGMFSQKIVDFVAQDRSDGRVVAIIELDDRTHDAAKDGRRDEMLKSAGYRVVRWSSKAKPDAAAIRAALIPVIAVPVAAKGPQQSTVAGLTPTMPRRI